MQGVTEFLPVSSSGHLVILQERWQVAQEHTVVFDILLHLGTLLSVAVYYRKRLFAFGVGLWPRGSPL
ncbi:MAG: undecaprenyl-diphosphate phosphatase, partial [Vicinamibacteria bacterium]